MPIVQPNAAAITAVIPDAAQPDGALAEALDTSVLWALNKAALDPVGGAVIYAQSAGGNPANPGRWRATIGGAPGLNGINAFSTSSANYVQPAVAANVVVPTVGTSSVWAIPGQRVFVFAGGGTYAVVGSSATDITLQNLGDPGNAPPGAVIPSPAGISPSGINGSNGSPGFPGLPGENAFTIIVAPGYTQPAVGATVVAPVLSNAWITIGQYVFVGAGGGGYGNYLVTAKAPGTVTILNLGEPGSAPPGGFVPAGPSMSPSGQKGGDSYTTLTADFTQPAVLGNVTISVATSAWAASGQGIFVATGGNNYLCTGVGPGSITIANLGGPGQAPPGSLVTFPRQVAPSGFTGVAGPPGPAGTMPFSWVDRAAGINSPVTGFLGLGVTLGRTYQWNQRGRSITGVRFAARNTSGVTPRTIRVAVWDTTNTQLAVFPGAATFLDVVIPPATPDMLIWTAPFDAPYAVPNGDVGRGVYTAGFWDTAVVAGVGVGLYDGSNIDASVSLWLCPNFAGASEPFRPLFSPEVTSVTGVYGGIASPAIVQPTTSGVGTGGHDFPIEFSFT